jgi:hypothetical protein
MTKNNRIIIRLTIAIIIFVAGCKHTPDRNRLDGGSHGDAINITPLPEGRLLRRPLWAVLYIGRVSLVKSTGVDRVDEYLHNYVQSFNRKKPFYISITINGNNIYDGPLVCDISQGLSAAFAMRSQQRSFKIHVEFPEESMILDETVELSKGTHIIISTDDGKVSLYQFIERPTFE